jgi:hypothetical protein
MHRHRRHDRFRSKGATCDYAGPGRSRTESDKLGVEGPSASVFGLRLPAARSWLGAAGLALLVASSGGAQLFTRPVPPDNAFFRFKAQYVVKATGEVVDFDLVRPCQPKYARDATGDSIDLGPLAGGEVEWDSHFGAVNRFPKVTKDHHAIVVKIPRACDGQTTSKGSVPPDLLPYASWYEDADDISEGLLYATEDAYRSPVAKIEFRGASIERATAADFREWVKHAADGFRSSRDIVSPLGFTQRDFWGLGRIAQACTGVERMAFPAEVVGRIAEFQPANHPRFWSRRTARDAGRAEQLRALINEIFSYKVIDGLSPRQYHRLENRESVPTFAHGSIDNGFRRPVPVFPYSHIPNPLKSKGTAVPAEELYYDLDLRPEMQGFLSCRQFDPGTPPSNGRQSDLIVEAHANGEPISGQPKSGTYMPQLPETFFEDAKYIYLQAIY